jgi:hypothetical protein
LNLTLNNIIICLPIYDLLIDDFNESCE